MSEGLGLDESALPSQNHSRARSQQSDRSELPRRMAKTSSVISPAVSPEKQQRQRAGPGNTRPLKGAFEPTRDRAHFTPRHGGDSGASSSTQPSRSHIPVKARPSQAQHRPDATVPQFQGAPSPGTRHDMPRGSSSSPPRGLREAYERIVDEEKLAAEESALEDTTDERDDLSQECSQLHDTPPARYDSGPAESKHEPPSPKFSLPSHRSSPQLRQQHSGSLAGRNIPDPEDSTIGSGSGSVVSGLSSLENGTDDSLVRTLAQHARDQKRINGALRTGSPVFGRARVGRRAGLTSENLQRKDKIDSIQAIERELARETGSGSVTSEVSDPPLQVPKVWGRRSRKGHDWMSKINEGDSGPGTEKPSTPESGQGNSRNGISAQQEESAIDWLAAGADTPVRSAADEPYPGEEAPRSATPSLPRERSGSEGKRDADDDHPVRPRQVSTSPQLTQKSAVLDRIREREIEAVKGRAVATSRLGELKGRVSKEHLRHRHSLSQDEHESGEHHYSRDERRKSLHSESHVEASRRSSESKTSDVKPPASPRREGDPIPDTPVVVYRKSGGNGNTDSGSQGSAQDDHEKENKDQVTRPERKRSDSRDLLLQLARAASSTPSPPQERQDLGWTDKGEATDTTREYGSSDKENHDNKNNTNNKRDRPTNDKLAGVDSIKKHTHKSSKTSNSDDEKLAAVNQTPAVAIGGWVATPATVLQPLRRNMNHLSTDPEDDTTTFDIRNDSRDSKSSPLSNRGKDVKGEPLEDELRVAQPTKENTTLAPKPIKPPPSARVLMELDSTMDSLDEWLANAPTGLDSGLDPADPNSNDNTGTVEMGSMLSDEERERRIERRTYERMSHKLQHLRLSIRDAKRGIESLESKVEDAATSGESPGKGKEPADEFLKEGEALWPCPECGYLIAVLRENKHHCHCAPDKLAIELPKLPFPLPKLYRRQGWRIKLTWLGLFLLIFMLYASAETITWYVPFHIIFPFTSPIPQSCRVST